MSWRRFAQWSIGSVSLVLAGCQAVQPEGQSPFSEKAGKRGPSLAPPTLRVLTYNVRYTKPNFDGVVAAILQADADVVCLQEVDDAWRAALGERLSGRYPHMVFGKGFFRAGGKAALARGPLAERALRRPSNSLFPVLLVRAETPLGPVELLNVHLRPPQWAGTAKAHRKEMSKACELRDGNLPLIVLGDFNEGDEGGAATWLAEQGLTNALRQFAPDEATWQWRGKHLAAYARFDHVFYSGLRCVSARVIDTDASDHRPVLAVFARP